MLQVRVEYQHVFMLVQPITAESDSCVLNRKCLVILPGLSCHSFCYTYYIHVSEAGSSLSLTELQNAHV